MRSLNKYIKSIILIYEAIENPILQRFLEIDTLFNPNYEYEPIDIDPESKKKFRTKYISDEANDNDFMGDVSSLFLEGDKMMKTKKRFEEKKAGQIKKMSKKQEQEKYLL